MNRVGRACPPRADPNVFHARRAARQDGPFDRLMGRVDGSKALENS